MQVTWNAGGLRKGLAIELLSSSGGYWQEIFGTVGTENQRGLGAVNRPDWTIGWHALVLEVDWSTQQARLVIDHVPTEAATGVFFAGSLYVELGGHAFNGDSNPKRVLYDDLVVRAR